MAVLGNPFLAVCSPGHFLDTDENQCTPCFRGFYNSVGNLTKCEACAPGAFAKSRGSATCDFCRSGMGQCFLLLAHSYLLRASLIYFQGNVSAFRHLPRRCRSIHVPRLRNRPVLNRCSWIQREYFYACRAFKSSCKHVVDLRWQYSRSM